MIYTIIPIKLYYCTIIPLYHYTIIPLCHYTIIPLYHYTIVPYAVISIYNTFHFMFKICENAVNKKTNLIKKIKAPLRFCDF
jgi:hypothetical protein